jgi:muconolactone delta-isomerase
VYDKILGRVVCDEKMSIKLDTNSKLLQLLASNGRYLDDGKVELDDNEVLSQAFSSSFPQEYYMNVVDQVFENMTDSVVDAKQLLERGQNKST